MKRKERKRMGRVGIGIDYFNVRIDREKEN
jgi:hypothetical protein